MVWTVINNGQPDSFVKLGRFYVKLTGSWPIFSVSPVDERIGGDNRPISRTTQSVAEGKELYSLSVEFLQEAVPRFLPASWRIRSEKRDPCEVTILFVPVSVPPERLAACWAEDSDQIIIRRCPICEQDSIVGHGRRRKQAHDEHHDWIRIRRGRCIRCGRTFTFLPVFSLPYTHYSLLARWQALLRRFVEHSSWEEAASRFKDADRLPDPSTVRRWSSGLDVSRLWSSFLDQILARVSSWLACICQDEVGSASKLIPMLEVLCPMRR